jgi:ribonuclease BN (tRNA processing enzyme)
VKVVKIFIQTNADSIYELVSDDKFTIQAAPMQHTVPCIGFVVTEHERQGSFKSRKS